MRRMMVFLMVAFFSLCVAGPGFSAQVVKGTVAKIEGSKLSVLDSEGQEVTISVKDPAAVEGLKVGDKVFVKDGKVKVIKEKEEISTDRTTLPEASK